jgi:hypothetical protein
MSIRKLMNAQLNPIDDDDGGGGGGDDNGNVQWKSPLSFNMKMSLR